MDLDNDEFAVREKARQELEDRGEIAETALRKVLRDKPSLEVEKQVEWLLSRIEEQKPSPNQLRARAPQRCWSVSVRRRRSGCLKRWPMVTPRPG